PEISDNPTLRDVTGQLIYTDSGLFTDGSRDTGLWNARCTTKHCVKVSNQGDNGLFLRVFSPAVAGLTSRDDRALPLLIRIDQPHTSADPFDIYQKMNAQAREFVASMDMMQLSARFQ
ncbi:MAG: hypothetical protein ABI142_09585, partial [Bryocella sp.]